MPRRSFPAQGAEGPVLLYTDAAAEVVLAGKLYDSASGVNLTEARMRELTTIDWNGLPFHWALTMKRGDGRRQKWHVRSFGRPPPQQS